MRTVPAPCKLQRLRAGDNADALAVLKQGGASDKSNAKSQVVSKVLQAHFGPLQASARLRYKKKMSLFRFADSNSNGDKSEGGHVGYCMLTFVLRNGIGELKKSRAAYSTYVTKLAKAWKVCICDCAFIVYMADSLFLPCAAQGRVGVSARCIRWLRSVLLFYVSVTM